MSISINNPADTMVLAKNFANPNPKSDNQLYEKCFAVLEQLCCQNHDDRTNCLPHPSSLLPKDLIFVKENHDDRTSCLPHPSSLLPKDLIFVKDDKVSRPDFFSNVDQTITQCNPLIKLNRFQLHTSYGSSFQFLLNKWFCYARDHNVQDVDLSLWHDLNHVERRRQIVLDDSLFVNSSLTNLKLSCDFVNPTTGLFEWTNLKYLSISKKSDLDDDSLEVILSGTPRLETFELHDCYGFTRIDMLTSKSVKNFVISGRKRLVDDYVHLNAPHILSLTVDGALTLCSLYFEHVASLVEAKFCYHVDDYGYVPFYDEYEEQDTLEVHILRLRHVDNYPLKLKLGMRCLEVLSRLKAEDFVLPWSIKVVDDEKFN